MLQFTNTFFQEHQQLYAFCIDLHLKTENQFRPKFRKVLTIHSNLVIQNILQNEDYTQLFLSNGKRGTGAHNSNFLIMAFVQQDLKNRCSSCQVNQEHLMKGLLPSVRWAASGRHRKPKGLIKGLL